MTSLQHGYGGLAFAAGRDHRALIGLALEGQQQVRRVTWPAGSPSWLVTGYTEACQLFRDANFSRSLQAAALGYRGLAVEMSMTEMDPPQHTRLRRLVSRAYSARQVQQLRPKIEQQVHVLLDGMFRHGPVADFNLEISAPLAFTSQCDVLGVPPACREKLRTIWLRRSEQAGTKVTGLGSAELQLQEYVRGILAGRVEPPTGLFADLVAARRESVLVSEAELTGIALSLLFDGPLLAESQLTNSVLCLLTHPGQLGVLREDPALVDSAVEELLRFCPAANVSMSRAARTDLALGAARIRAGDVSLVALPLANRDPAVISAPDRLDITRGGSRHLSFGHGVHYCLGAHLTRMLILVTLTAVLRRLPHLALAVPEQELRWYVTPNRRSLRALPVSCHGRR